MGNQLRPCRLISGSLVAVNCGAIYVQRKFIKENNRTVCVLPITIGLIPSLAYYRKKKGKKKKKTDQLNFTYSFIMLFPPAQILHSINRFFGIWRIVNPQFQTFACFDLQVEWVVEVVPAVLCMDGAAMCFGQEQDLIGTTSEDGRSSEFHGGRGVPSSRWVWDVKEHGITFICHTH